MSQADYHLPALRLTQATSTADLPNVHVIPNHDLDSIHPVSGSIHSAEKVKLGERVAMAMLATVYKQEGVVWSGPRPVTAVADPGCSQMRDAKGSHCVVVTFSTMAKGGLDFDAKAHCPTDSAGAPLILPVYCNSSHTGAGFELELSDGWEPAESARAGAAANTVVVSGASAATRIRYAYSDWPVSAVRNSDGSALPARVFDLPVKKSGHAAVELAVGV